MWKVHSNVQLQVPASILIQLVHALLPLKTSIPIIPIAFSCFPATTLPIWYDYRNLDHSVWLPTASTCIVSFLLFLGVHIS
ncbi:hypothetical protein F4815DRAFT_268610 [Daldinia loculata]|nr:hypothetical protein F4815DRAFT_268610 [Daldinia loculata]